MNQSFHAANRKSLSAHMADGDLMLFFSGESVLKTADEHFPFFTNRNFLYLTGVKQEGSALLMQKRNGQVSERLFVTLPDAAQEVWTGRRFTTPELNQLSGVEAVEDVARLNGALNELVSYQNFGTLWLCFDSHLSEHSFDLERDYAAQLRAKYPHLTIKNSYPLLAEMRKFKTPEEIDAVRKAMRITDAGIRRLMQIGKPGMMEYELEAEFNAELARHGQRRTAFPSIVAGGERIFYLHYTNPISAIADGDLILSDVGAAYDEYCTDISRVFPANGRFSKRQAQLYQVAFDANRALMDAVRPGVAFQALNPIIRQVSFEGLKALGLLNDIADIGKYVWHGAVHHVGLDTHDVGSYLEPVAENMIFTVDAGIYVREWGIGLRIEDNVLVTADGCENLSAAIPATIDEIESLMAGGRR